MSKDKAWECALETEIRDDGARIEGHPYKAKLKVIDHDTDREYEILTCDRCGHSSVAFSGEIHRDNDSSFDEVIEVGTDD